MSAALKGSGGVILAALFFLCVPLFARTDFSLGFFILCLLYSLLGQSWNIVGGYAGQMSFGHSAFFGAGAYTMGVLQLKFGVNPWPAALVALLVGAAIGAIIGSLSFRYGLRGSYFALVTLAFAEVLRVLANSFEFTGGGSGLLLPFKPALANLQFADRIIHYYILFALVAVVTGVVWWIERSRFGSYLVAIREDEQAALALGINTFRVKLTAMVLSASGAALAGIFYIQYFLFIDAGIAFGPTMSIEAFLAPLIGGAGTLVGPLLGSVMLGVIGRLTESLSGGAAGINLISFGILLLLMLRFLPDGFAGLPRQIAQAVKSRREATRRA